jgi:predicted DCC family thiol-disulfide oxidoreductase YuxK
MQKTYILYNAKCPICAHEMNNYIKRAQAHDLPMFFQDLNTTDLGRWKLTRNQAMQNLYVMRGEEITKAIPAFTILWKMMPRYRLWARFVNLPGMRQLVNAFFDRILMPNLYKRNKRRQGREVFEKRIPKNS